MIAACVCASAHAHTHVSVLSADHYVNKLKQHRSWYDCFCSAMMCVSVKRWLATFDCKRRKNSCTNKHLFFLFLEVFGWIMLLPPRSMIIAHFRTQRISRSVGSLWRLCDTKDQLVSYICIPKADILSGLGIQSSCWLWPTNSRKIDISFTKFREFLLQMKYILYRSSIEIPNEPHLILWVIVPSRSLLKLSCRFTIRSGLVRSSRTCIICSLSIWEIRLLNLMYYMVGIPDRSTTVSRLGSTLYMFTVANIVLSDCQQNSCWWCEIDNGSNTTSVAAVFFPKLLLYLQPTEA